MKKQKTLREVFEEVIKKNKSEDELLKRLKKLEIKVGLMNIRLKQQEKKQ